MAERVLIVLIFRQNGMFFALLPFLILSRIIYYLTSRGHLEILGVNEPGALFQKIKIKSELLVDLLGSPLSAILICLFIP